MRKLLKRMFSLVITLAMTFNMFAPLSVLADGDVYTFTFTVENTGKYSIEKMGDDEIKINENGTNNFRLIVANDSNPSKIQGTTVACEGNTCTMTVPYPAGPNKGVRFNYDPSFVDIKFGENLADPSIEFTQNTNFEIKTPSNNFPLPPVANDPIVPTGSLQFVFTTNDNSGFELSSNNNSVAIKDTNNNNDTYFAGFNANSAEGPALPVTEINCNTNKLSCVVTVGINDSVRDVRVVVGGGSESDFNLIYDDNGSKREYYGNEKGFTSNTTLTVKRKPVHYKFDGTAVLIWECSGKANSTCFHAFDNLPTRTGMDDDLDMNYFLNTTVTDVHNANEVFDPSNFDPNKTGFAYATAFSAWMGAYIESHDGVNIWEEIDFSKIDPSTILNGRMEEIENQAVADGLCERTGNPSDMENCLEESYNLTAMDKGIRVNDLAEQGANSYVSFGDNEFKITIYNDNYQGLKIDENESSHTVDTLGSITPDAFDISESTLNNPVEVKTLLLEDTIKIRNINGSVFKTVEPLNTPEGAIEVSSVDGIFTIKFNSNYFDRTVFKITTIDEKVYYVKFIRRTIDVNIYANNPIIDKNNVYLETSLYFDEDTSHSDYEVLLSPVKKDGTIGAPIVMKNLGKIDRGGANVTSADEVMIGRKTKKAVFYYDLRDDNEGMKVLDEYQGFYINVRKKGSTDTNYAGTFAGNGKGIYYVLDMEKGPHLVY